MAIHGLPADFELTATNFSDCVREGASLDIELRILRPRNPAIWIRRLQGAVQDITGRKEAADRALQMGERLAATLESVTDSFFTMNQEWRFTYVNQEAERMLRRPARAVLHQCPTG